MTPAVLLDNRMPVADVRRTARPSGTATPQFAQHLDDARTEIAAEREERKGEPRGRVPTRARGGQAAREREPGTQYATAPAVAPAAQEDPRPLDFNLTQSAGPDTESLPGSAASGVSGGAAAPAITAEMLDSVPLTGQAPMELQVGDFAFAAKISTASGQSRDAAAQQPSAPPVTVQRPAFGSPLDIAPSLDATEPEPGAKPIESPAVGPARVLPVVATLDSPTVHQSHTASPSSEAARDGVSTPSQVAPLAPANHQPTNAPAPLRNILLQVGGGAEERVDVQLAYRSGDLHVAVRSGSADLAHDLRQGISELVGKLESGGYHAEVWRPGTAATASTSESSMQSNDGRRDGEPQTQSGWSHDGNGRQRHDQSKPRWVEDLEGNLTNGTQQSSGRSYGFIS